MLKTLKYRLLNQKAYVVSDLLECLSIELTYINKNKNIVTCLYRQPDSSIDDLINNIEIYLQIHKEIYIYVKISI